jgi:hypothetical protein
VQDVAAAVMREITAWISARYRLLAPLELFPILGRQNVFDIT